MLTLHSTVAKMQQLISRCKKKCNGDHGVVKYCNVRTGVAPKMQRQLRRCKLNATAKLTFQKLCNTKTDVASNATAILTLQMVCNGSSGVAKVLQRLTWRCKQYATINCTLQNYATCKVLLQKKMQRHFSRCKKMQRWIICCKSNATPIWSLQKMQRLNRRCKNNATLNYSLHTNVAKSTLQPINFFATSCLTLQSRLCNESTFLHRYVWRCKVDFATNQLFCIVTSDVAIMLRYENFLCNVYLRVAYPIFYATMFFPLRKKCNVKTAVSNHYASSL